MLQLCRFLRLYIIPICRFPRLYIAEIQDIHIWCPKILTPPSQTHPPTTKRASRSERRLPDRRPAYRNLLLPALAMPCWCGHQNTSDFGDDFFMWILITERYSGGKPEFGGIPYLHPIRNIVYSIIDHAMVMSQAELFRVEDDFSIWLRTQGLFRSSLHHCMMDCWDCIFSFLSLSTEAYLALIIKKAGREGVDRGGGQHFRFVFYKI